MNHKENESQKIVLILEDDFLLAKCFAQIVDSLTTLEVIIAHTNSSAIAIIENSDVVAAFIDIRLELETSEKTAHALLERNIPFAFVSGQPLSNEMNRSFPESNLLIKPARKEQIEKMLGRLI